MQSITIIIIMVAKVVVSYFINKKILRFEVSVQNVSLVAKVQASQQLIPESRANSVAQGLCKIINARERAVTCNELCFVIHSMKR